MTNWLYGRTRICNGQPTGIIETRRVDFFDVFADGVGLEAGDFFPWWHYALHECIDDVFDNTISNPELRTMYITLFSYININL